MFAIKQVYTSFTHPDNNKVRVLRPRYKTLRNAEKRAQRYRWVCKPDGTEGAITEKSTAEVIEL